MTCKLNPDFVFYHTPKCGGTSAYSFLEDLFIYLAYKRDTIFSNNYSSFHLGDIPSCERFINEYSVQKIKVILCHIKYKNLELSKNFSPHRSLLISRDPTDRIISHYNFFERPTTKISLENLETDKLMLYVNDHKNLMTAWTGSHGTCSLNRAIKNLEEITYTGTLENFEKLLTHVAQTECKIREKYEYIPTIPRENVTNKQSEPCSKETKDLIREMCEDSVDLKLHKHIIEKEKEYYNNEQTKT